MAILPLLLSPGAEARTLLHHLLEHGDIVGKDTARPNQLAVDDWMLENTPEVGRRGCRPLGSG